MSAQTSMLHIRVDDDIKDQATQALTAMGLSMSEASQDPTVVWLRMPPQTI